jgi:phosphate transport system permease protein
VQTLQLSQVFAKEKVGYIVALVGSLLSLLSFLVFPFVSVGSFSLLQLATKLSNAAQSAGDSAPTQLSEGMVFVWFSLVLVICACIVAVFLNVRPSSRALGGPISLIVLGGIGTGILLLTILGISSPFPSILSTLHEILAYLGDPISLSVLHVIDTTTAFFTIIGIANPSTSVAITGVTSSSTSVAVGGWLCLLGMIATALGGILIGQGAPWLTEFRLLLRRPGDLVFRCILVIFVFTVVAIVIRFALVLVVGAWPTIRTFGFSFLTNRAFDPVHNTFGVSSAIFGTLVTSAFALLFALPFGVGTAIFLVEFCPGILRGPLSFLVDAIAAVPSVVIGLWGISVFAPWLQKVGEPWLQEHLGFLPFFQGSPKGVGLLAAGCVLTVMILPIITSISREVISLAPSDQREGLLALGATHWEVIRHVVLPFARVGIAGSAILALGRALGETIAVTLLIGNQATAPSASLFDTGYSLASVIANQFGEATPGLFFSSLVETGLLLLLITLLTNIAARLLIRHFGRSTVAY